jgi:hypothetical protein
MKYNLSKEGMDLLMEKLSKAAQGDVENEMIATPISTDFVKRMTKVKGIEDVVERDEQLSKTYQGFLSLYGFETMYDMYIYAMSCEPAPEGLFKSDSQFPWYESVNKTIMRNGKPKEVLLFIEVPLEELEKADSKPKKKEAKKGEKIEIPHARQFSGRIVSSKDMKDPNEMAKLKAHGMRLKTGDSEFSEDSHHYLVLKGNNNHPVGIVGYTEGNKHIKMDFYRANGKVSGVGTRGFFELMRFAKTRKKGVQVRDNKGGRQHYIQAGLTKNGDNWEISYEELLKMYGED